jgi:hypothetical protein
MTRTIMRIAIVALLLALSGPAPVLADSGPVPFCYPKPCGVPAN